MGDQGKKCIVFIAWDNPNSNYLEGLFVPIFEEIQRRSAVEFHVIQFSWAGPERIHYLRDFCVKRGVLYHHIGVFTRPSAVLGKQMSLLKGLYFLWKYVNTHKVDFVMPRSTMPAKMVLMLKTLLPSVRVIFDADGLPIEERVDFANLKPSGFRFRQLKRIERSIIDVAEIVFTRTKKAIDFLSEQYDVRRDKFYQVVNGRDETVFKRSSPEKIRVIRSSLGLNKNSFVGVYCGSIGPQYGVEQMLYIHRQLISLVSDFHLLVLTNNPENFRKHLKDSDKNVIIRTVRNDQVPEFLSAADVAFAIRKAAFSMIGVSPIKIAEYLLVGLPVVASAGIGDTEEQLAEKDFVFILQNYEQRNLDNAVAWIQNRMAAPEGFNNSSARQFGLSEYTLRRSAETYIKGLSQLH